MEILRAAVLLLFIAYVVIAAIYIIMENRSPQSTFAWLFLFLLFPLLGVVIYHFFGHGWRAFSKTKELARQELGSEFLRDLQPIRDRQHEYSDRIARERPASYHRKLMMLVERNSNSILTGYNRVEVLQNASQKYPRLLADVKAARHSVHLIYYIWTEDSFTLQVKAALIERAKAGVEVRCLYDASGGALSEGYLGELTAAGVAIHPYLEYRKLGHLHAINYRSHRKIVVVDGAIGYVGGLNLDKAQSEPTVFKRWRDTHLRIVGEGAQGLQASFATSWFNTTGQKVVGPAYYPPVAVDEFLPVQLTQGGPDSQWHAIRQIYFLMITSAERRIFLQSPFFIPDESILEALRAALAGLDVRLMFTPRGGKYQVPYRAAHTYFRAVAEAGAKIYLYQDAYFHPKTLTIDGAVTSVGTANMDIRSFGLNYETIAILYDQEKACELEREFLADMEHCTEWSLETYKRYSPGHRLVDSIYRLASPLL